MVETLRFLDSITPLWAVFASALVVEVMYVWVLWSSIHAATGELWRVAMRFRSGDASWRELYRAVLNLIQGMADPLSVFLIYGVLCWLYFSFWVFNTPIDVRGSFARFWMEALCAWQFLRGASRMWWQWRNRQGL